MSHEVDSTLSSVECVSSSRGVIMPHVVSPEVVDGEVTTPQIARSGERMEKSSRYNGSNTLGWSIGCGCLTTLGLVFVAYECIYLRLRDGYTSLQCVGFWINVLLVVPVVFIGVLIAFEGGFWLIRFLRSRMCSLWKKKNHGDTKGSNPIDTID